MLFSFRSNSNVVLLGHSPYEDRCRLLRVESSLASSGAVKESC
jgi:hypothetical protein